MREVEALLELTYKTLVERPFGAGPTGSSLSHALVRQVDACQSELARRYRTEYKVFELEYGTGSGRVRRRYKFEIMCPQEQNGPRYTVTHMGHPCTVRGINSA